MLLKNARVMTSDFKLVKTDVLIENSIIRSIGKHSGTCDDVHDLDGHLLLPGLIDIHIHGCAGYDTCDATLEAIEGISSYLIRQGVTSFCPTTMTVPVEEIEKTLINIKACIDEPPKGAEILGVNMEGPYIAVCRKGGQNAEFVRKPDWDEFQRLFEISGGIVKIVNIAPECDIDGSFIKNASKLCLVSVAHTDASYAQAKKAFEYGAGLVTHLFNAMSGFNHREPGTVGAVFDESKVMAELICDGFHVHPAALRVAFKILGEERVIIVSDAMRAAGMPDGQYMFGGQQVDVSNGQARLINGTIAGYTTNLLSEVKNLVSYGLPFGQVIKAATLNPARAIGEEKRLGSIEAGKVADMIVLDGELNLKAVIKHGKFVYQG